jgi:DnaK suppressor protein
VKAKTGKVIEKKKSNAKTKAAPVKVSAKAKAKAKAKATPAKKVIAKKVIAKKPVPKKAVVKKAVAKKVIAKKVQPKKVAVKKVIAKKVVAKKAVAKPVKKSIPLKKVAVKKAAMPAKKTPITKAKPAAKKSAAIKKPIPKKQVPHKAPVSVKKPVVKAVVKSKVAKTTPPKNKPSPSKSVAKTKTQSPVNSPVLKAVDSSVTATAPGAVPIKSGRPSSRLAGLTVPSMAQSVASTAAKASYSQTPTSFVIVPMIPATVKKDSKLANNWKTKQVADLKDTELMAMPDSEYMNEVQLAAFRLKLSILKRDILNSAGETTEHLREDTSVVPDPADRATIEEEHALELRTRDRERKLLKKIEQSIARIDAGDYGYCDETGEPIGVGRLIARPTATLSLEAQQRRELKQKMFGD